MANALSNIVEQARLTSQALYEYGQHLFEPTIRLGVTGLSRAGKTVFITALVHGLLRGGRFPVFEALAGGRIARARLSPQPDDTVPRFAYEAHLEALIGERHWPESTKVDQRIAAGDRISVAQRRDARTHARHCRLSRRMAARSAAASHQLRRLVGRNDKAVAPARSREACGGLARQSRHARRLGARERTRGAECRSSCSPIICAPAATSVSRSACFRPAAS